MRDGVRLNTEIYVPKNATEPLPILLTRTPYGLGHDAKGFAAALGTSYAALARDGYVFVFQDIRGRSKSEGQFVMLRPVRDPKDPKAVDEGSDTYDTVEWLLEVHEEQRARGGPRHQLRRLAHRDGHARSPSRGEGGLAPGLARRHVDGRRLPPPGRLPAELRLRVRVPAGGGPGEEHPLRVRPLRHLRLLPRPRCPLERQHPLLQGQDAELERFRRPPQLRRVLEAAGGRALSHSGDRAHLERGRMVGPGRLLRPGEDLRDPREEGQRAESVLVVGPWNHGGWAGGEGSSLGRIALRQPDRAPLPRGDRGPLLRLPPQGSLRHAPARGHFLRDREQRVAPVRLLAARTSSTKSLYLREKGGLSFTAPTAEGEAADAWVSDPANPVPYRPRPIEQTYPDAGPRTG